MISRILEPEVMDSPEEARDYDAMDHRAVNEKFVYDWLAAGAGDGLILDLGTGTAQIPILLCQKQPRAKIIAVDYADHMLALARKNVLAAGLQDRLILERADAKRLPYPDGVFTAVISNSIIHHIPEPRLALREMVRVAAPNGFLFVRDLLRPNDETTLKHLVQTYAGDANDHQRKMFADSLHAALTLAEIRDMITELGFPADTVQQTTDRHWTWSARKA